MNKETARYADCFAALGSEPRLEIMRLLFAAYPDGMTVGDLQAQLKIPNSTLSHHLEKLRVEDLVSSRRDRQFLWYSAKAEKVEELLSFLYNGCSICKPAPDSEATYSVLELVERTPPKEELMFEQFIRSIQGVLGGLFERTALLVGFEQFTQKAVQALSLAQAESRRLGHRYIGTEQLLLGLLREGTGVAAQVLAAAGVNLEAVQQEVERNIGRGPGTPRELPFTPRAKQTLELALEQSRQLSHHYVGTEHLLLGILQEGEGLAVRVLKNLGVNPKTLEQQVQVAVK